MNSAATFDPAEFRKALGRFTTGVTVITTRTGEGHPVGITANSFNSVSLNPPLVLWSLAKTSRSLDAFSKSKHWAVHILSANQDTLSSRFAKSGENKFEGVATKSGVGDIPLLPDCTACLQCKTTFMYEGGDHVIFVGEVVDFTHCDAEPLVFHGGRYALATPRSPQLALSTSADTDRPSGFHEDFLGYLLGRAHFDFHLRLQAEFAQHGIGDLENYVIFALNVRERCSVNELESLLSFTGHAVTLNVMQSMVERDLVQDVGDEENTVFALTQNGRDISLRIIAQSKSVESEVLDRLGYWNSVALKNLLKLLIVNADTGIPHPWNVPTPSPTVSAN